MGLMFKSLPDQPLICMITTIVDKVKGFLLNPVETFQQSKDDSMGTVVTYFAALLLLNAVLSAIVAVFRIERMPMFAGMPWAAEAPVFVFFFVLVCGFIAPFIFGAWLHLWVYIFGGRKGIFQTIKAVMYGNTPRLLFGWIPFVGFIFMLWSLVLGILGVRELQELSPLKAILAVAVAVMIPLILLILLAAYFFTTYMTTQAIPSPPTNII
jgi:hypothetical protein